MKEIKAGVLDRFEQTYELLFSNRNNFFALILPIFLYKIFFGIIVWNFISFGLLGNLDLETTDIFSSPFYITVFFFIIVGSILYITFFIGFLISIIKTIKDILDEKEFNIRENLKYGFNNLIPSFNTYWYIFAYIVLWPFLFISVGGILIILGYISGITDFNHYGLLIMGFGFLLLLFFVIYRGTKTKFSLVSAVDYNSYTKENFIKSIVITDTKWWRIFGNFVLIGLIISIISSIVGMILSIFSTSIFDIIDFKKILYDYYSNKIDQEYINNIIISIKTFYNTFYLNNFIVSIFTSFYENIVFVFTLIFTFIFYKRLEFENKGFLDKNNTEKKEIEL